MPIDEDAILAAYRKFLGREPEMPEVMAQARDNLTYDAFFEGLTKSEEFQRRNFLLKVADHYRSAAQQIEVDVPPDVLHKLIERTQRGWKRLGETEPYWSVLTSKEFLASNMTAETRQQFYETGRQSADLIEIFEARAATKLSRKTCFELGCGVGRVTRFLARRFQHVVAVDISPGNLEICRQSLAAEGIRNVECRLIERLQDYETFDPFDVLYSFIVLQHNSPPIQKYVLDQLTRKVRRGGGALFQIPCTLPNYAFDAARYLASPDEGLEMHALPMPSVLTLLQQNGLTVLEATADTWTGGPGSYTYFAVKPQGAA